MGSFERLKQAHDFKYSNIKFEFYVDFTSNFINISFWRTLCHCVLGLKRGTYFDLQSNPNRPAENQESQSKHSMKPMYFGLREC